MKFRNLFSGKIKVKKNTVIFLIIFALGLFLRTYQIKERFFYGHDQDLSSFFVKDVVVDKHLRLIGQETSTQGVFIGALFYYLLVPFFLIFAMDPIAGTVLVTLIALFGIVSIYFVFNRVFGQKAGLVSSFIYSVSAYTVFNDREVVPTMPVIIWTIWYLFSLDLLLKGFQKKSFVLLGILVGLIWHLNFALVLVLPLIPLALVLSKKKLEAKSLFSGVLAFAITSIPLFLFEFRHNFIQTRSIFLALTTNQHDIVSGLEKLQRVFHLLCKNVHSLFMGAFPWFGYEEVFYGVLIIFLFLLVKKIIKSGWAIIFLVWIVIYLAFFSLYSKIVSEYYLNGTIIVFITIATLAISNLIKIEKTRHIGFMILSIFLVYNLIRFFNYSQDKNGYLERKAIISEIKRDAQKNNYPCVSISYITNPGYNLGYRYLIYLAQLKTKAISEKVPVYTIVYPLKTIYPVDVTRGAIGIIYPDYKRYNQDVVSKACQGEDFNITEPLWGLPDNL